MPGSLTLKSARNNAAAVNQAIVDRRFPIRSATVPAINRPTMAPTFSTSSSANAAPSSYPASRMICGSQVFNPYTSSSPMTDVTQKAIVDRARP